MSSRLDDGGDLISVVGMKITVNGDAKDLPAGTTLRQLVEQFNLKPEKVAIELNRRLARAEKYDQALNEGDVVEIVTFVGGG
jgi:thiamine biosynthesis protein ThiS